MNNNNIRNDSSDEFQLSSKKCCDICYEDYNKIIELDCCNGSKKICVECISCLTHFICPYCRQNLPEEICEQITKNNITKYNTISSSAPEVSSNMITNDWENFIHNEYLIDPFTDYYHNRESRILRRRLRQLRKRYLERNMNRRNETEYTESRRRHRRNLRNYTNNITQQFQRNRSSQSFNNSSRSSSASYEEVDDEMLFTIDD
tara:strand:- start:3858 stop:4469 length:612 start_codon:yes stop_codon:yes gene_type:complete